MVDFTSEFDALARLHKCVPRVCPQPLVLVMEHPHEAHELVDRQVAHPGDYHHVGWCHLVWIASWRASVNVRFCAWAIGRELDRRTERARAAVPRAAAIRAAAIRPSRHRGSRDRVREWRVDVDPAG